ncbi:MAG: TonB-dependent receptor [Bacteroidia bacterium]|jgi:outer membrane receptor protein involved in Fe transport|nr:TonB-dependent receptor [Bacteroidia bacterium]
MRFSFLLLTLFSLCGFVHAQTPAQRDTTRSKPAQAAKPQQPKPQIGKVIGIVLDTAGSTALEYVTLTAYSLPDSAFSGGGITDKNGQFQIPLPAGRFYLRISFIGYNTRFSKSFLITPQATQADLGRIYLNSGAKQLNAVEVSDARSDYSNSIDKKVYDVNQNITNTGGTATDILQNIPSVAVDMDGKVSLRGSENVTILIDGRPSGITGADRQAALQQVPASMIDRIEIITNPSARYDAQGMAGIINIITKKDAKQGLNGSVTLGQGSNGKYNGALNLNNRMKKANLFANYNWRSEDRWMQRQGEQHTFTADTNFYFTNGGRGLNNDASHFGKIGADFYLNAYNTLSVSGGFNYKTNRNNDSITYSFLDADRLYFAGFDRIIAERQKSLGTDWTLDYAKAFPGSQRKLTGSGSFSYVDRQDRNEFRNSLSDELPYQKNNADNIFATGVAQIDYTHPLNDSLRFETGVKYSLRNYDNNQAVLFTDGIGGYVNDTRYSDNFIFNEHIYAAYVQAAMHRGKFDFQAGVRAEQTQLTGTSTSTTSDFVNNYFGIFPSVSVRYSVKPGYDWQVSYSRRLNRPGNGQLNPFVDISDSINLRSGNPFLQPEYINSAELNLSRTFENGISISGTAYFRHTTDLINMVRIYNINTGIALIRPINFTSGNNFGIESVFRMPLPKRKGNVMLTLSGFRNQINGENLEAGLQSEALNWSGRLILNYRILPQTNLQVTGFYNSPFVQPAGSFIMVGGIDAGIRQDVFKGRGQFTANVSDIFDTKEFRIFNKLTGYELTAKRKRESRILMISFTWRFGKAEENPQQRRNRPTQSMDEGGGGMF